jgi:hypothetical protein
MVACAAALFLCAVPETSRAQLAPGPYEILPFDDGFILEAFKDLNTNSGAIADWTGWSGTSWVSPNPYDNHIGSDFSVQTGTPLHAATMGTVSAIGTGYPQNDHSTYYGNYVKIAADGKAPNGESLDVIYGHMLSVAVSVGQRVNVGDYVGLSDNTGNSTTEHVHFESDLRGSVSTCPFYWAHFKYPIMFNPAGTLQVGRVVRVTAISTPIRTDRSDTSTQISTAWQGQLYFCSYPKRGYYQVFIPNTSAYRSGWLKATDVEEVFTGTVLQPLPDPVVFAQLGTLQAPYSVRSAASDSAGQMAQIVFGGGRFVADQVTNGYYRIPVPGASPTWGWVKPNNRMVVYPQLTHPSINLAALPNNHFPLRESFSTVGKSLFGRPKFNRSVVKSFSPAAPNGDGKALFVTDATNSGDGTCESVSVGQPWHRNYYVQCDVYFNYRPAYLVSDGGYERYGIFLRDDGFAGLDTSFEGAGNGYALLWDADDGRLRTAKLVDGGVTDFQLTKQYVTTPGWHTMRIEARGSQIRYFLDGSLLIQVTDSTFPSGTCGLGYTMHFNSYPAGRGAYFDNFVADSLDATPRLSGTSVGPDGQLHVLLSSEVGTTNIVERAPSPANWSFFTNVILTNASAAEFLDSTNAEAGFYRAKRLP